MSSVWQSETVCRDKNVKRCGLSLNNKRLIYWTVELNLAEIANIKIKTNKRCILDLIAIQT